MRYSRIVPMLCGALMIAGCAGPSLYVPFGQSHYVPPTDRIATIKHVQTSVSHTYVRPFQQPDLGGTLQGEAMDAARASQPGASVIIDGGYELQTTTIPLLFVNVETVTATVDGTAAGVSPSVQPQR
jgi:hypothetical protein